MSGFAITVPAIGLPNRALKINHYALNHPLSEGYKVARFQELCKKYGVDCTSVAKVLDFVNQRQPQNEEIRAEKAIKLGGNRLCVTVICLYPKRRGDDREFAPHWERSTICFVAR